MKRIFTSIAIAGLLAAGAGAQPGSGGLHMMDDDGPGWGGGTMGMGPGMMGPGMMGADRYWTLDLNDAQRDKILSIERAASDKQWELMGRMREQRLRMHESFATGKWDEDAQRRTYQLMSELHKAMFESSLQARKEVEAVLTPEQRAQLAAPGRARGRR